MQKKKATEMMEMVYRTEEIRKREMEALSRIIDTDIVTKSGIKKGDVVRISFYDHSHSTSPTKYDYIDFHSEAICSIHALGEVYEIYDKHIFIIHSVGGYITTPDEEDDFNEYGWASIIRSTIYKITKFKEEQDGMEGNDRDANSEQ